MAIKSFKRSGIKNLRSYRSFLAGNQQFRLELYSFTTFTFTTGGANGRLGPSYSSLVAAYSSASWASNTAFFNATNGVQLWTVPATGTYRIQAAGAQGGGGGGLGARIRGDFTLTEGQKLRIVVGQAGGGTAGGGGSYVVNETGNTNAAIYVIAGGGGGKGGASGGTNSTSNANGSVNNGNGGIADNSSWNGPTGGGFFTSGQVSAGGPRGNPGDGFLQGSAGGPGGNGEGGFGGGGSGGADSIAGGGGGGGYSGGSGGPDGSTGQGAGSYPNGANQLNEAAVHSGNGFVTITKL